MTKQECIERAAACRKAYARENRCYSLIVAAFGADNPVAQSSMVQAQQALNAATQWDRVANMHHKTRQSVLRNMTLPDYIFGY